MTRLTFRPVDALLTCALLAGLPATAAAQRFTFERRFPVDGTAALDVQTERGKIDVSAGTGNEIVVVGTVTVRVGWNVPTDAVALAQQVAHQPPVQSAGNSVRLRPPAESEAQRAVTVSYEVRVPPTTSVTAISDSGATKVDGIGGKLSVRTSSGAITLSRLGGETEVTTGSGAVSVVSATGEVSITTQSSGIDARELRGGLRARTQSGSVEGSFIGEGDVDVETSSSAITLRGVNGGLAATTRSGRVIVTGTPRRPWTVTTTSGSLEIGFSARAPLALDATTDSGSIVAEGLQVEGTREKRRVEGAVSGGGPRVHLRTHSGSIKLQQVAR